MPGCIFFVTPIMREGRFIERGRIPCMPYLRHTLQYYTIGMPSLR
jgi:hypothetical protein